MGTTKEQLLSEFESCLFDFWGEEPTRQKIVEAWEDYLDAIKENEKIPRNWYSLTKSEKKNLYKVADI